MLLSFFQIHTTQPKNQNQKMQTHLTLALSTFLLLFTSSTVFCCATASPPSKNDRNNAQDLVRSSCIHARYPTLCLRTLSKYAGPANTPLDVAQAALKVSLAHARRASKYLKSLQSPSGPGPLGQNNNNNNNNNSTISKRQRAALSDCVEQMADSVDELKRSLKELQHLRTATFRWQMSNAQTWVSAALTDGDTCLDGLGDGGDGQVRRSVKRRVTDMARVTSNALYMINRVDEGGAGKHKHRSGGASSKN